MPRKPRRPCATTGCPNLALDGKSYCKTHQREQHKTYDRFKRDPLHRQRYNGDWQKLRNFYIHSHPLCEDCLLAKRFTQATEVHHVVPLRDGGENTAENLRSLCHACHMKTHVMLRKAQNDTV